MGHNVSDKEVTFKIKQVFTDKGYRRIHLWTGLLKYPIKFGSAFYKGNKLYTCTKIQ